MIIYFERMRSNGALAQNSMQPADY